MSVGLVGAVGCHTQSDRGNPGDERPANNTHAVKQRRPTPLVARLADTPAPQRRAVARSAAVAAADPGELVVAPDAPAVLLDVVAAELEARQRNADALALRVRAARAEPDNADYQQALARAAARAGDRERALRAWDRTAALMPALDRPPLAAIEILVATDRGDEARRRAAAIETRARASGEPAALRRASHAAALIGANQRALTLARRALAIEPGNGANAVLVARRLETLDRNDDAATVLMELLVCGRYGQPWHRHEVALHLAAVLERTASGPPGRPGCPVVDPADLRNWERSLVAKRGPATDGTTAAEHPR